MKPLLLFILTLFVSKALSKASESFCMVYEEKDGVGILAIIECTKAIGYYVPTEDFNGCPAGFISHFFNDMAICICDVPFTMSYMRRECVRGKMVGESCNYFQQTCDQYSGLNCFDSDKCTCDGTWEGDLCNNPKGCRFRSSSNYNETTGKCFPVSGTRCANRSECGPNAECVSQGAVPWLSCKCLPGYTSLLAGCELRKTIGQDCSLQPGSIPCDESVGLTCTNGTCTCRSPSTWDNREEMCRRPLGASCSVYAEDGGSKDQFCGWKAYCHDDDDRTCRCADKYEARDGVCYGTNKARCAMTSDCGQSLVCVDGICECNYQTSQTYDNAKHSCLGQLGFNCISDEQCSRNLKCVNSRCDYAACPEGSTLSLQAGNCFKTLGSKCRNHACNKEEGLACVDETCRCLDFNWEYVSGRGCVAGIGSVCGNVSVVFPAEVGCPTPHSSCDHKYNVECKKGACIGGRCT